MSRERPPKRILVFDDSPVALQITQAALEREGFSVSIATDLLTFEERRTATLPDLILLDVQMPEAFGDDIGSTLRGLRRVDVPILLLSALDDSELERRAAEADIDGWISKRAGVNELVRRVKEFLE